MKKIQLLLFVTMITGKVYTQVKDVDLPAEFKDVAVQAFQKVSPATKQWFINTANQHPAGSFDTAWTKKKLRERFGEGVEGADPVIDILTVMMAYQVMINKDERVDKKMKTESKQMELTNKENKLKLDNAKINQQKKEANEKADNAMTAAQTDLWIGIVSGNSAIVNSGLQQSNQKISNVRLSPVVTQKKDSSKMKTKNTDGMQQEINKQEKQAADDDKAKKASEDHKKVMKDAIKKLLDQMAQMKSNLDP